MSKIATYLGFCVRSGTLVFGTDNAEKQKKGVYLLMTDGSLAENSLKHMRALSAKLGCPLLETGAGVLGELLHRPSVKAVAIKEKNLASAILTEAGRDGEMKLYSGGEN